MPGGVRAAGGRGCWLLFACGYGVLGVLAWLLQDVPQLLLVLNFHKIASVYDWLAQI